MIFFGIGIAVRRSHFIPGVFGTPALVVAVLFVVAGIAAIAGPAGVIRAIVMSVVEAVWILVAALAFAIRAWW